MKARYILLVAVFATFHYSSSAQAVPCDRLGTGVTPSTECRDAIDSNDNDSASYLNSNFYFGKDDWVQLDKVDNKDETPGTNNANYWSGVFFGTEGYFNLYTNIWNDYDHVTVVLKDGGAYSVDGTFSVHWAAYLLEKDELGYTWIYGYTDKKTLKNISHLALYAGGDPENEVPEPAAMLLFGTGLAGVVGVARKRKK